MNPEAELPQSIDAIMASIRASLAEDVAPKAKAPAPPAAARPVTTADGGTTLEGLVRAALTPLLQEWLDAHLPEIVERATHAEIKRLTGRLG